MRKVALLFVLAAACNPKAPKAAIDEAKAVRCQANLKKLGVEFQVSMQEIEDRSAFPEMGEGSIFWTRLREKTRDLIHDEETKCPNTGKAYRGPMSRNWWEKDGMHPVAMCEDCYYVLYANNAVVRQPAGSEKFKEALDATGP